MFRGKSAFIFKSPEVQERCFETSETAYLATLYQTPDNPNLEKRHCENLKSRKTLLTEVSLENIFFQGLCLNTARCSLLTQIGFVPDLDLMTLGR
jgi:hypothetical protein